MVPTRQGIAKLAAAYRPGLLGGARHRRAGIEQCRRKGYVRHHTHCEIPKFYEAADEVGMLGYPLGFNLHVFQAKAANGRVLASGLDLLSDNPESVYLLDRFIRYAKSPQFDPTGEFNLAGLNDADKS